MAKQTVEEELTLTLWDVKIKDLRRDCYRIRFETSRGNTQGILHHKEGNVLGTVMVGGSGGGLDGPASIYRDMGPNLLEKNISTLRLDYRHSNYLEECVLDILMSIEFMKGMDMQKFGLVGWSFGGAVVIDAGVASEDVQAVATVASQAYGTGPVEELAPKALLLLHGTADRALPPACSQDIYSRAREPKELVFLEGGNHGIDQKRQEMMERIETFLAAHLSAE